MAETRIEIVSGFLGAGKTTFLNYYLPQLSGISVVLENEFGDVNIDGNLLPEETKVQELFSGCICCSLVGDFEKGLLDILKTYQPTTILVEPSGVSKLSSVQGAVAKVCQANPEVVLGNSFCLVEVPSFFDYVEEFGEFYLDQIRSANVIILAQLSEERVTDQVARRILQENSQALIIDQDYRTMPWDQFSASLSYGKSLTRGEEKSLSRIPDFQSMVLKGVNVSDISRLNRKLKQLAGEKFGRILRCKGVVTVDSMPFFISWTPAEYELKEWTGAKEEDTNEELVVIGLSLKAFRIKTLFDQGGAFEKKIR